MGKTASAFKLVTCPNCGHIRSVTDRHARRNPQKCRFCKGGVKDGHMSTYERFWLRHFCDEEIALMSDACADRPLGTTDPALVASARMRNGL